MQTTMMKKVSEGLLIMKETELTNTVNLFTILLEERPIFYTRHWYHNVFQCYLFGGVISSQKKLGPLWEFTALAFTQLVESITEILQLMFKAKMYSYRNRHFYLFIFSTES